MSLAKTSWFDGARPSAVALGFTLSAFVACTSDDPAPADSGGDPADCSLIANRCHPYSEESDVAHDCHEVGHDGSSPKRCTEMRASCESACPVRDDAGTGGSSGAGGAMNVGGSGGTSSGGTGTSGGTASGGASGSTGTAGQGGASGGTAGTAGTAGGGGSSTGGAGMAGNGASAGNGGNGGSAGGGGTSGETACETLGRVCHEAGTGRAEECHELGHGGDEEACEEELAECLDVCQNGGM